MNYTNVMLFGLGLLGVLIHCLVKINDLKKRGAFKAKDYFELEWANILLSAIIVVVAIICKTEIKQLEQVGNWLGLAFVAIGYMGQSILVSFLGKASKVLGTNPDDLTKNINQN